MAQLSKIALDTDIASNIYSNKQKLIKGNTVRQRLLNLKDSSLNTMDDLNAPLGYLGIDSAGRVNVSFITSASPAGKYLRDDGSWQIVSAGLPSQVGNSGKALFTDGVNASWTNLDPDIIETALGYAPVSNSLSAGNILVGNGSNQAAPVSFTLSASGGAFSLSASGVLTMPNASTSARGLLIAGDWNTFNNKQNNLGYTPVNVSGDTMLGTLVLNADAVNPMEAVTFQQLQAWQIGLWDDRGTYNASVNTFPASGGSGSAGAILKGDIWTVSVAGTLGGVSVNPGDTVRALVNTPGQTSTNWSVAEGNLGYTPLSNVLSSGKIFVGNGSNVATSVTFTLNATPGSFALSNAGVLTMPNADGATRGLLSSTDWTTFNNKQAALGYTPVSNALTSGRILVGNGSNIAAAVVFSLSASGGSFSLAADGTLTMPNAATAARGLLTSSDWNIFNNKVSKTGSNSTGQVAIFSDANTVSSSSDVTYSGNYFFVNGQIVAARNIYSQQATHTSVGGVIGINTTDSSSFSYTLNADTLFNLANMENGMTVVIDITQDSASPHNVTFSGITEMLKWKDNTPPTMTAAPDKTDVFTFIKSNNIIYGFYTQNF